MKKKKKLAVAIIMSVLCANMLFQMVGFAIRPSEDMMNVSKNEIASDMIQDNYMVIEKRNNWTDFSFVFGNRVLLLSLNDGKEYQIMNYNHILDQFYPMFYVEDRIYGMVGNGKGMKLEIYEVDIRTGKSRKILGKVSLDDYAVANNTIVYGGTEDVAETLMSYDIENGETTVIDTKLSLEDADFEVLGSYEKYIFIHVQGDEEEYILRYDTDVKTVERYILPEDMSEPFDSESEELKKSIVPYGESKLLIAFEEGGLSEYDMETQEVSNILSEKEAPDLLYGDRLQVGLGKKNGNLYYCVNEKGVYKKNMDSKKAELVIPWDIVVDKRKKYDDIEMVFAKDYAVAVRYKENGEREYEAFPL